MRTWKGQAAVIRVCSFCVLPGLRQLIPLQRVFREKHQTWGSAARTTRVRSGGSHPFSSPMLIDPFSLLHKKVFVTSFFLMIYICTSCRFAIIGLYQMFMSDY